MDLVGEGMNTYYLDEFDSMGGIVIREETEFWVLIALKQGKYSITRTFLNHQFHTSMLL